MQRLQVPGAGKILPVNHIEGHLQAPLTAEVGVAAFVEASQLCKKLDEIAMLAKRSVRSVDHVGVTLIERRRVIRCLAATDAVPLVFDNLQRSCGHGPCFNLLTQRRPLRVADLTEDSRWPLLAVKAAATTPIRAMLA